MKEQTLSPLGFQASEKFLCSYSNQSSYLQVIKIKNIQNCKFERVVFPGERLLFEAEPDAQLEIYIGMMGHAIIADRIKCDRLQVDEEDSVVASVKS